MTKWYVYGNQIDEPLAFSTSASGDPSYIKYYLLDHLNSPAVLFDRTGTGTMERYEYDAYGSCTIMNYSDYVVKTSSSLGSNPILFTGRNVDYLDGGSLKLQYNRNRYYSQDMGRWLTKDPLGTNPSGQVNNPFKINSQYSNGMNLYEYVNDNPLTSIDPFGLVCGSGWSELVVPDSYLNVYFTSACKTHDRCYSGYDPDLNTKKCKNRQGDCDMRLYRDMMAACANATAHGRMSAKEVRKNCESLAEIYLGALTLVGDTAFNKARANSDTKCGCSLYDISRMGLGFTSKTNIRWVHCYDW